LTSTTDGRDPVRELETPVHRPSITDVAKAAGVAVSSVSRVLSSQAGVSPEMRVRVMEAVMNLGYEPNLPAQSLRRGTTMTVGFVIGDISNPLFAEIVYGAEVTLQSAEYSMLLMNSRGDASLDAAHVQVLRQRQVDGLLLSLATETNTATLEELARTSAPVVLIDRDPEGFGDASAVLSDHNQGMIEAVGHLIALGHRRIGLVNGNPNVRPARERAAALRKICRRHPGVSATIRSKSFSALHGEAAAEELLNAGADRPTALISGGNQILPGVLRAVRRAGLRIPDDISLVTCDDAALTEFVEPPLATISRDPTEIGRVAADLVLRRLRGAEPSIAVLPTYFRPTKSTAPPSS
jgi:LacI family transcriptional regulator